MRKPTGTSARDPSKRVLPPRCGSLTRYIPPILYILLLSSAFLRAILYPLYVLMESLDHIPRRHARG